MGAPAFGEGWETRRLLAILTAFAVVASMVGLFTGTARADHQGNTNSASYWEAHYQDHQAQCFKHDPPNESTVHGGLNSNGTAVILNAFNPAWPGDHWEALIVNGGPQGDAVYEHPSAGVEYFTPGLNPQGNHFAVSHWIVCKGTTPQTTTTVEETTTTSEPETTTTTVEETTTTSEPETTTTTVEETTTTSEPETTTTTVEETTTTSEPETTTSSSIPDEVLNTVVTTAPEVDPEDELPFTGLDTDVMIGLSILLLGLGAVLLTFTRKLEEN